MIVIIGRDRQNRTGQQVAAAVALVVIWTCGGHNTNQEMWVGDHSAVDWPCVQSSVKWNSCSMSPCPNVSNPQELNTPDHVTFNTFVVEFRHKVRTPEAQLAVRSSPSGHDTVTVFGNFHQNWMVDGDAPSTALNLPPNEWRAVISLWDSRENQFKIHLFLFFAFTHPCQIVLTLYSDAAAVAVSLCFLSNFFPGVLYIWHCGFRKRRRNVVNP